MYVLKRRYNLIGAVVLVAAALVLTVAPMATTQPQEKCFGKVPTLSGDSGDNPDLIGSDKATPPKRDVIVGLEGNDTIQGDPEEAGGDSDFICGGEGDDDISGRDRSDFLKGNEGDDTINGGTGIFGDEINGGPDDDTLNGGSGDDTIKGASGNDIIDVGAGNSSGPDTIKAGSGDDTVNGFDSNVSDTIDCGEGTDTLHTDGGDTHSNCETVVSTPPV